jgi:predicted MFS family arabinose efflux permease
MGLHSSAITAGFAIGAPLAGAVIDLRSPQLAFAVAGLAGVVVAGIAWVVGRQERTSQDREPDSSLATISAIS